MTLGAVSLIATLADTGGSLVPAWIAVPMASIVMICAAGHLNTLTRALIGHRRRSIRTAIAFLTIITAPILAIAFGIATTDQPKPFVLSWIIVMVLVSVILVLATVDTLITGRTVRTQLRSIRAQQRVFMRDAYDRIISESTPSDTSAAPAGESTA